MEPIHLGPNQPAARPYRGGAGIVALRGEGSLDPYTPEDFVASTTTCHGTDTLGLTVLPDGRTLRDAVRADPTGWLGADHVARFGDSTGVLVKILHTGERLFNHAHPDGTFARAHLDSSCGKTESWMITDTGGSPTGTVWLGWRRDVSADELADWFERQDVQAMLDAMHEILVQAGDAVYVPAGTPHSIGEGITMVEAQEPTDLSIILEYAPFPALTRDKALLGLDVDTALSSVATGATTPEQLAEWHRRPDEDPRVSFLPAAAAQFFRAERLTVAGSAQVEPGFAVLVVLDGGGMLRWDGGELPLTRGSTVVTPYGAGALELSGTLRVIRCAPPNAVPDSTTAETAETAE